MNNVTLLAVPLFIFMGTILEKSGIVQIFEKYGISFRMLRAVCLFQLL